MTYDLVAAGDLLESAWLALAKDVGRCTTPARQRALEEEINWITTQVTEPQDLFLLGLTYFPAWGKVFDAVLSSSNFRWADEQWSMLRPHHELFAADYCPFVDTILGERDVSTRRFSTFSFMSTALKHGFGSFDPTLVQLARQMLYFVKKTEVDAKGGSDVLVAEEFWFRRNPDTSIQFYSSGGPGGCQIDDILQRFIRRDPTDPKAGSDDPGSTLWLRF